MFAGIVIRDDRGDPRDLADRDALLAALTPYRAADRSGAWLGNGALLVQALTWNTSESRLQETPEICDETGRVFVGWVRIDNRPDLRAQLRLPPHDRLTDAQLILAAHRAWGAGCADRLQGDFSFAIYDPARHRVFCARDALGVRPFFYHLSAKLFVFASSAAAFLALRRFDAAPSREWLARFLIGESADPVKTAYAQIRKLPPAHTLELGRTGAVEPVRYWDFADTAPDADHRDERWVDAYRDRFHQSVEARLRSAYRVGAENSGGLDSSTIIGHAVNVLPGGGADLPCFSVSHMEREPGYILDLASYCGIRDNYVLTRPSYHPSDADKARAIRMLGYPPEHGHAFFHVPFFEQAEASGVRTLLSGFGGDEIVTSSAEFLRHELLLRRRHARLMDEMPGNLAMRAARTARLLGKTALGGAISPARGRTPRLARSILRDEVVEEYGLTGYIEAGNAALRNARTVNEHLLAKPGLRTFLIGRIEACTLMAASYGIEYRWPLLDRRLIAQYLATPSIEKRHRHVGRYLHRRAGRGTIPDTILWKPTKDFGGIPYIRRDPGTFDVDPGYLPSIVSDLVDSGTVIAQSKRVQAAAAQDDEWLSAAPERNNLRALGIVDMWLKQTAFRKD